MAKTGEQYVREIKKRGLTIYDPIRVGDPDLWIPDRELETLLHKGLVGFDLKGLPNRTRAKVIKTRVCAALGYPIPDQFIKTRPRFPGQNFDTYGQKSNNLQVWNEDLSPARRYVLIRISAEGIVSNVRVVDGETLALLDTTGTLTQKYQAAITIGDHPHELLTARDTENLTPLLATTNLRVGDEVDPTDHPEVGSILPIRFLFSRLVGLLGRRISDAGRDQERTRGGALHKIVCEELGYVRHLDDGRFPDVRNQLLEVKLQTARTIDLGLVSPDDRTPLDTPMLMGRQIRHCDVRYAIFYGTSDGPFVTITRFYLTTGEAFFTRFRRFEGKILNRKLQIPLPDGFL